MPRTTVVLQDTIFFKYGSHRKEFTSKEAFELGTHLIRSVGHASHINLETIKEKTTFRVIEGLSVLSREAVEIGVDLIGAAAIFEDQLKKEK